VLLLLPAIFSQPKKKKEKKKKTLRRPQHSILQTPPQRNKNYYCYKLQTNKHASKKHKTVKELEAWKSPTLIENKPNSNQKSSELCNFFLWAKSPCGVGGRGFVVRRSEKKKKKMGSYLLQLHENGDHSAALMSWRRKLAS
jgi:hypothetical protein